MAIEIRIKETTKNSISVYVVSDEIHNDIIEDGATTTFSFFYRKKGETSYKYISGDYQVSEQITADGNGGWQTSEDIYTYYGLSSGTTYELKVQIDAVGTYEATGNGRTESSTNSWTLNTYNFTNAITKTRSRDTSFSKAYYLRRLSMSFKNSGTATFYTEGSVDTFGYLTTENDATRLIEYGSPSEYIEADDDSGDGSNFKITCDVVAGTTYYLIIRTYDGEETGTVTTYIVPPSAPITHTVTFNHIYNDSVQKTTSATIEYGKPINLENYAITVDGYKYDHAVNSDATEVESVTITEDTFFDLYYIPIKVLSKWDWQSSNGSYTANVAENLTLKAYNAFDKTMLASEFALSFSYLVWNDLCEKVDETLIAAGGSWKTTYESKLNIFDMLMPYNGDDLTIYAAKYNLLQWQIYRLAIQYGLSTEEDWSSSVVQQGQDIDGIKHFVELTELLNDVIDYVNTR